MENPHGIQEAQDLEPLKAGDSKAWDEFFKEHDSLIRSVVPWPKWHFQPHTREDIAQHIRVDLTRAIPKFRGDSSLANYVKRICVRRCIDQVRREVRQKGLFVSGAFEDDDGERTEIEFSAGSEFDPRQTVLQSEQAKALAVIVEQLDNLCKIVIRQFYMQDLSYKEIAELNNITVNTVGARLSKCLNKLRAFIKKDHHFGE